MGRLASAGLSYLHIGGKPVPAGRPRVSRWGTYYPKTYSRWLKESWKYAQTVKDVPTDRPVALLIEVVAEPLKASKFDTPMGDADNFAKGPMDLLTKTKAVWNDDRQVVFLTIVKRFAEPGDKIGFHIWWCEINE
jgi:Holliday junction resolvase RusA-like endonuclease